MAIIGTDIRIGQLCHLYHVYNSRVEVFSGTAYLHEVDFKLTKEEVKTIIEAYVLENL